MTEKEILKRIYPSVVTFGGDWRKMIADVKNLKLEEISLFLTVSNQRIRKEIFTALKKTSVKNIYHVHLRDDMLESEIDYLVKNFNTKTFTIHFQYIKLFENSKYSKRIFIENNSGPHRIKNIKDISKVGGLCIDLSHYTDLKNRNPDIHQDTIKARKIYKVGCNHLSAVLPNGRSIHHVKNYITTM